MTPTAGKARSRQAMREHPLIFTFRDVIAGRGFLAGITVSGKGLMVREDRKWWLYGVRPGGIAESGETPEVAFMRFRQRYQEVLFDIAEEAPDFDGLRATVEALFSQPYEEGEEQWESALAKVRAGTPIPKDFHGLPRRRPESNPFQMQVQRLDAAGARFMPTDNVANDISVAA